VFENTNGIGLTQLANLHDRHTSRVYLGSA
jgi:hypothetical protein